jgi:hypothetical protein
MSWMVRSEGACTRVLITCLGSLALLGCSGPRPASWWIEFDTDALRARAVEIDTTIRVGGCAGTAVAFESRFPVRAAMTPPVLGPGTFGFEARARDARCTWFAAGCTEVVLPAAGATTRLVATTETLGTDCEDASVRDAGPVDARTEGGSDAAPPVDTGARPPCATLFGAVSGFELCAETVDRCRFYAVTDGSNCNALCEGLGSSCVAVDNDDSSMGHCVSNGAATCGANATDTICTCVR